MTVQILIGDARQRLKDFPDASVHCCVTSPPYFGLRDYGVDGQMGLEATPAEFVDGMVALFREVRRVLRDDGTLWLNLGDSYARNPAKGQHKPGDSGKQAYIYDTGNGRASCTSAAGLADKQLIGIPWRVAFALQADGWYLRQDIIWHKPNPMPESVRDRCTKAHEYLFLLSKSARYHYDADAVAEGMAEASIERLSQNVEAQAGSNRVPGKTNGPMKAVRKSGNKERKPASARGVPVDTDGKTTGAVAGSIPWEGSTRNKRSVWTIATRPFSGAHFATFPSALVEPCILAGCPAGGTVLDPFGGAGTTGMVAERLGRDAILIELNPAYADMARDRLRADLAQVRSEAPEPVREHGPLFGGAA